jgi:hypothetical protein
MAKSLPMLTVKANHAFKYLIWIVAMFDWPGQGSGGNVFPKKLLVFMAHERGFGQVSTPEKSD